MDYKFHCSFKPEKNLPQYASLIDTDTGMVTAYGHLNRYGDIVHSNNLNVDLNYNLGHQSLMPSLIGKFQGNELYFAILFNNAQYDSLIGYKNPNMSILASAPRLFSQEQFRPELFKNFETYKKLENIVAIEPFNTEVRTRPSSTIISSLGHWLGHKAA